MDQRTEFRFIPTDSIGAAGAEDGRELLLPRSIHSDTSRPFEKPKSCRIAVKVINHLGDEVMKVFRVEPREGPVGVLKGNL